MRSAQNFTFKGKPSSEPWALGFELIELSVFYLSIYDSISIFIPFHLDSST